MADRFPEQFRRVMDLAEDEADRLGHRYIGPEHLVLGLLRDGGNRAAWVLRAHGVGLAAARAALGRLAERGLVPGPRPSDAELWVRSVSTWRRSVVTSTGLRCPDP
jgi:ATP-dependent Clp protease ATP-binding subunit ClpC